jgi:hypothetical protein
MGLPPVNVMNIPVSLKYARFLFRFSHMHTAARSEHTAPYFLFTHNYGTVRNVDQQITGHDMR